MKEFVKFIPKGHNKIEVYSMDRDIAKNECSYVGSIELYKDKKYYFLEYVRLFDWNYARPLGINTILGIYNKLKELNKK